MQPNQRKRPSYLIQLLDLTLIQLSNWRWSWRRMIVTGMVVPLFGIVGLGIFAREAGQETLSYILIGNVVVALMFENMGKVSGNFAYMRAMGTLNYFATLPVYRHALVLGTVIAFGLLSLPALLVTIVFGSLFLGVSLHIHPLILLVIPLVTVPLASLGALIGISAHTPEEANYTSVLLTFGMMALGPVLIPPSRLPDFMSIVGYFSPATYAASALRQVLLGPLTTQILVDLTVLATLAACVAWLVVRRMDWRQE